MPVVVILFTCVAFFTISMRVLSNGSIKARKMAKNKKKHM